MSEPETYFHAPGDDAFESESSAVYTIETVEKITHISREQIVLYYRYGLVSPVKTAEEADLFFDDEAIHKLRRIAFLLSEYGINHEGLRMVSSLLNEVEKLREEVRFLRKG
jgi:DNA-binding transcriptional MerR regulator